MIINAAVFYSKADKRYIAEGYEIGQIGTGTTQEVAMQDYLSAVESTKQVKKKEKDVALFQSIVSPKCISILEKVALDEVNTQPIIKKIDNLEIHFYKGR